MSPAQTNNPEFITPPDTLSGKISVGPNGVDIGALDRADAVIASLKDNYLEWVVADLEDLTRLFNQALATPEAERGPAVGKVFFRAHDMKGQGGSFNYHLVTQVGNLLCRFIEARESVPDNVFDETKMEVIKLHIDAIRIILTERWEGDGGQAGQNLVSGLQAVISKNAPPIKR